MSEHSDYIYRPVVVHDPTGDAQALSSTGESDARARLRAILEDPNYSEGWIERAEIKWERCK